MSHRKHASAPAAGTPGAPTARSPDARSRPAQRRPAASDRPTADAAGLSPEPDWIDAQSESAESLRASEESVGHGEGDLEAVHEQKADAWLDADTAGGESVESLREEGTDDWLDADSAGRGGSGGSSEP